MMMRELSSRELSKIYDHGVCPFCGSREFLEGHGGVAARHLYCANMQCFAGFSLAPAVELRIGHLIHGPKNDPIPPRTMPDESLLRMFTRKIRFLPT
jgi:hypothetical protein